MKSISRYWLALLGAAVLPIVVSAGVAVSPLGSQAMMPLLIAGGIASAGVASVAFLYSRNLARITLACESILGNASQESTDEFDCIARTLVAVDQRQRETEAKSEAILAELAASIAKLGEGPAAAEAFVNAPQSPAETALAAAYRETAKRWNALRQRQALSAKVIQEIGTPIFSLDDAGMIRYSNTASDRAFGKTNLAKRSLASLLVEPSEQADPFGRAILSPEAFAEWLKQGGRGEAIVEVPGAEDSRVRLSLRGIRLTNSVEGVWYFAARDLTEDYRRASMDRADTREQALRAIWDTTARASTESIETILAATRLITSDAKQATDRDTMLARATALRQHAGGLEGYLRTVRWLNMALWGELPKPLVSEFQAIEPVKAAIDQLAPRFKARNVTVSVNDQGGWICGDEEWLRTAILGILFHAAEAVSDAALGVHLVRLAPLAGATEERVAFEVLDAGAVLTAAQMADLESPFGGLITPSFLTTAATGYMPGLILGADLARRMGGTLEFDATPGGGLVVRFVLPTRVVTGVISEPAGEPSETDIVDELVMGWKLGVA